MDTNEFRENQKMNDLAICPWSILESHLHTFKKEPTADNFEKIFTLLEKNSMHGDFWKKVFDSYTYIDKFERATKLIQYLENENEKLNESVELNVRKNTLK